MDYLFINQKELSALIGIPYIQQSAYLLGIRPYMDRKTFLVGLKRRISYQSLAEALYIEPHQGYTHSGSPSRQQLRRIVYALEKAGLVEIHSFNKHLILKCSLANENYSDLNKADTNPTQQPNTNRRSKKIDKSYNCDEKLQKDNKGRTLKPDTPHNSKSLCVSVNEKFEKFWESYPLKANRGRALMVFENLDPSNALFKEILSAIHTQIKQRQACVNAGQWVPRWKFPDSWLSRQGWLDEIETIQKQENQNATAKANNRQKSAAVIHSEASAGVSFDFED